MQNVSITASVQGGANHQSGPIKPTKEASTGDFGSVMSILLAGLVAGPGTGSPTLSGTGVPGTAQRVPGPTALLGITVHSSRRHQGTGTAVNRAVALGDTATTGLEINTGPSGTAAANAALKDSAGRGLCPTALSELGTGAMPNGGLSRQLPSGLGPTPEAALSSLTAALSGDTAGVPSRTMAAGVQNSAQHSATAAPAEGMLGSRLYRAVPSASSSTATDIGSSVDMAAAGPGNGEVLAQSQSGYGLVAEAVGKRLQAQFPELKTAQVTISGATGWAETSPAKAGPAPTTARSTAFSTGGGTGGLFIETASADVVSAGMPALNSTAAARSVTAKDVPTQVSSGGPGDTKAPVGRGQTLPWLRPATLASGAGFNPAKPQTEVATTVAARGSSKELVNSLGKGDSSPAGKDGIHTNSPSAMASHRQSSLSGPSALESVPSTVSSQATGHPEAAQSSFNLKSATAQQDFSQLLQSQIQNGVQNIQVKVYPEGLGSVLVSVHHGETGVAIQVMASNPATAAWLQQDSGQLLQSLQSAGVQVASVHVGTNPQQDGSQHKQHSAKEDAAALRKISGGGSATLSPTVQWQWQDTVPDGNYTISVRA